ncbi:response regulator [Anaerobacillus alkaliphilus]|uniref:Response regulator n=1 Tax=Anaerobacillus alkaliphilus TaxID=1548597 RepID=A0A4Q0VUA2_9BACI|nr:response regulator [Anaerobacillus alkaliphilus]RXJ01913.1 response regulator [Anaerobacillus alkaliphilus]
MEKYQKLFLDRMKKTFKQWEEKGFVEEASLYRFLHTVKGTAASIGLVEISNEAEKRMVNLDEHGERQWTQEEWKSLLVFLADVELEEKAGVQLETEDVEKVTENEKLILVVDDDITMVNYLKENLENQGYMVLAAVTGEKALQLFYDHKPDCILLDLHLPDQNGLELLETILGKSHSYFIPIIIISSDDRKETRIKGYEIGAVDFLAKPFAFDELKARIENRIRYKELISNAVLLDELTGAFNRKFFNMELNRYLYELNRRKDILSLVILDLDHFKRVNDTYGHNIGDVVLRGFAQFIMANKRSSDYLIRYGGEEFILLLPHTKREDAEIFINRLLADFAAVSFPTDKGSLSITFSAGIVEVENPNIPIEDYVKMADQALYQAKDLGRNQVIVYEDTVNETTSHKVIRIAVIDDDPVVHQLVNDRLGKLSFGNIEVDIKSYREGESFFQSKWHNQGGRTLVLLDGIMPRMDGLEVLRKLRQDYDENSYVVLMLTGRKSEKDIVKALELGADDYLTKPFSMAELEARVKRLVKRMMM